MNIRDVKKFVEPGHRLQWQHHHVPRSLGYLRELLSTRPIDTKYKSDFGPSSHTLAYIYEQLHPLFLAKASRIKRYDRIVGNPKLNSQRNWMLQRVNNRRVHPVWKENAARFINSLRNQPLYHLLRNGRGMIETPHQYSFNSFDTASQGV